MVAVRTDLPLGDAPPDNSAGFVRVIAPARPLGMSLLLPNGVRLEWQGELGPEQLEALVLTARANGIEPYAYLCTVFSELPQATSVDEIEAVLPLSDDGADSARVS